MHLQTEAIFFDKHWILTKWDLLEKEIIEKKIRIYLWTKRNHSWRNAHQRKYIAVFRIQANLLLLFCCCCCFSFFDARCSDAYSRRQQRHTNTHMRRNTQQINTEDLSGVVFKCWSIDTHTHKTFVWFIFFVRERYRRNYSHTAEEEEKNNHVCLLLLLWSMLLLFVIQSVRLVKQQASQSAIKNKPTKQNS